MHRYVFAPAAAPAPAPCAECGGSATWVVRDYFNVNGTTGLAFYYFCAEHGQGYRESPCKSIAY